MKMITKVNIKYILLSFLGAVVCFFTFFYMYEMVADGVPDGILGFLLFVLYAVVLFGACIAYEFYLFYKCYKCFFLHT